ncbi:MAG: pyridoxal phosphate-dependent aminotransferase [Candidatus Bathyarchaeia archaeon]
MKFTDRVTKIEKLSLLDLMQKAAHLKDVIYLNVGEPDFCTPIHIVDAAKKALEKGLTRYTPDEGIEDLRKAIAEKESEKVGCELTAENVLVTCGGVGALFAAAMSAVETGDEVLVQSPYYPGYQRCVNMAGGKIIGVLQREGAEYQLGIDELNEKISHNTRVIIINSPNNPTGCVLTRQTLRGIADLAKDHDLMVISDEVYEKFVYEVPFESIASLPGMMERTLIVNSFSKTYAMTGWRVGYAVGPEEWIRQMGKVTTAMNLCANSIAQYAALEAIKGPQQCVEKMVKEYSERRKLIIHELNKIRGFNVTVPMGAFYVFPETSNLGMSETELAEYLINKARVVVSPGHPFFGPGGRNHIRIAYTVSIPKIKEAMERIRNAIEH